MHEDGFIKTATSKSATVVGCFYEMSDSVDMPSGGQIKNSKPLSELSAATAEQVEEEADLVVHHSELPGGLVNFDPQGGGGDTPSSSSESEEDGDNGEGGGYMLLPQEPTELDCEGVEQSSPVSRDTGVHSAIENIATSVSDQSGANTVPENVEAVSNIGEGMHVFYCTVVGNNNYVVLQMRLKQSSRQWQGSPSQSLRCPSGPKLYQRTYGRLSSLTA